LPELPRRLHDGGGEAIWGLDVTGAVVDGGFDEQVD
jgi:hypothetical protein